MSVNFSTHSAELQQAYNSILDQSSPNDWAMFSYGHGQELKVTGTGDGGLEELKDEFEGSKIQYAFARVVEQLSGLPKFVLISWCGEGVPVARKGFFNIHVNDVAQYFKGFHVHINARSEDDVEPAFIMGKVRDSSGAKYSIQGNVANPSVNKPPPKTPAFAPPKSNSYAPNSYTPKPAQPIQPAKPAKPAYTPAPAHVPASVPSANSDKGPKALYESVGSAYQPIKTNPKPLSAKFGNTFDHPTPAQNTPAPPVTSSIASRAANFSQPPVTSSYQPIKLAPKPLYDEGTAKVAYNAPSQPIEGRTSVQRQQEEKLAIQRQQEERLAQQKQQDEEEAQRLRAQENQKRRVNEQHEQQRLQEQQRQQEQRLQEQQRLDEQRRQEEQRLAQQEEDRKVQERLNNLRVDDAPASVQAIALYDYAPDESNEIPLTEGETITNILEVDEGWWQGTNSHGQSGLFPANYVEVTQASSHPAPVHAPVHHEPEPVPAPAPVVQPAPPAQKDRAIALYDYDAAEPNELTFSTDDTITNIEFVSDDWWMGTCKGSTGLCKYKLTLVPANYVELL
ncbi:hypothetical protein HDV01_000475 [Terramyces sp. JEL0728]|nr:hypothetical protein HDV01_000475 [Terramyces sp. JEL0728]